MDSGVTRKARRPTALLGKLLRGSGKKGHSKNPTTAIKSVSNTHQTIKPDVLLHITQQKKQLDQLGLAKYVVGFVFVCTHVTADWRERSTIGG